MKPTKQKGGRNRGSRVRPPVGEWGGGLFDDAGAGHFRGLGQAQEL